MMGTAHGDALVLVHGYLGDGMDWRGRGVTAALLQQGWRDGGLLPQATADAAPAGNAFYTVELASEAPLLLQAEQLTSYLAVLQKAHSGEQLILAGHSAGGVVARLTMVRNPALPVAKLITIGSPHLGTQAAELGWMASQSPLGWLAPMMGADTLNRSQALYADLSPETPGSVLFWLNRQPHPQARYISVVRAGNDSFVPAYSQHLESVPALNGKASSVLSPLPHGLHPSDGALLLQLLEAAPVGQAI
jgi:pimeloyl-ACP methyl ester carboxylesterase